MLKLKKSLKLSTKKEAVVQAIEYTCCYATFFSSKFNNTCLLAYHYCVVATRYRFVCGIDGFLMVREYVLV